MISIYFYEARTAFQICLVPEPDGTQQIWKTTKREETLCPIKQLDNAGKKLLNYITPLKSIILIHST